MVGPATLLLATRVDSMGVWAVCHRGMVSAAKCIEEFLREALDVQQIDRGSCFLLSVRLGDVFLAEVIIGFQVQPFSGRW